ncbi:MAG: arsinothricin resistance N-acetyltransferase ArsN1 family B [Halolamina sp.]
MATIRLASPDDAADCAAIYTPVVRETAISFEERPPSVDELRERLVAKSERYPWLVCEHEGEVLGFSYAGSFRGRDAYRWSAEATVYVDEAHQRAGVATALYASLFEVLRLQGFYSAYAVTALPNPASVGLHESVGFEPVGEFPRVGFKHGEWHDVRVWRLALRPPDDDPAAPTSMTELAGSAALRGAIRSGFDALSI